MVKILIIGGPGSGKTTFVKKLSHRLNIPCFELDDIFWDNTRGKSFNQKRSEQERLSLLNTLFNQHQSWIIEGVYTKDWVHAVYEHADHIFYLDTNVYLRDWRILKRYLKRTTTCQGKKQNGSFLSLIKLLHWNHSDKKNRLIRLQERLNIVHKSCYKIRTLKKRKNYACKTHS